MADDDAAQPRRRRMAGIPPLAAGATPAQPAGAAAEPAADQAEPAAEGAQHRDPAAGAARSEPATTPDTGEELQATEPAEGQGAQAEAARPVASQAPAPAEAAPNRARRRMGGASNAPRVIEGDAQGVSAGPVVQAAPAHPDADSASTASDDAQTEPTQPSAAASAPQPVAESAPDTSGATEAEASPAAQTTAGSGRRRMGGASNAPRKNAPAPEAPEPQTPEPAAAAAQPAAAKTEPTEHAADTSAAAEPEQSGATAAPTPRRRRMGAPAPEASTAAEPGPQAEPAETPTPGRRRMGAPVSEGAGADPAAQSDPGAASAAPRRRMGAVASEGAGSSASAEQPAAEQTGADQPAAEQPASQKPAAAQPAQSKPAPAARPAQAKPATKPVRAPMSTMTKSVLTVVGVVVVGVVVVLLARWLRTLTGVEAFIGDYSGHASQPDSAPVGIPGWLGWQHFFNMFLMVLIVRTGLQVRWERRPPGYWTPTQGSFFSPGKQKPTKVSMSQWLHQSLDVLWVLNGLIYVVLLAVSGHWMRIVPTSWDIFPNMVSAALQYASLDWPLTDGWVHYNALQMSAYFITVFIAAPLAIITGLRLSTWWPQQNQKLSRAFPVEIARTLHFPVMIYFVAFTVVHVFLVFFTGVLSNLNYMYTSRDVVDFWGLIIFLISLVVIVAGWLLTKPLFMRPVANTMGTVTKR